jgi:hypothetical protein
MKDTETVKLANYDNTFGSVNIFFSIFINNFPGVWRDQEKVDDKA